jgi:hypothetical protein
MLCVVALGCKSSDTGTGGGTGGTSSGGGAGKISGGSSGSGASGSGASAYDLDDNKCINGTEADNPDCTQVLSNEPTSGNCAPKGKCCHRASNIAKAKQLGPDDPLVLEYSLHYSQTINHPKTISTGLALSANLALYVKEQQNTLWRIEVPRKGGEEVSGMGNATIGYGAYNCDGTYSMYSATAAPNGALSNDPARWTSKPVPMMVDVSKTGYDRYHTTFADESKRREFINLPYVKTAVDNYPLDWELSFMGFHMIDFKTEGDGHDCAGSVGGGANGWTPGGHFEVYTPVFGNNKSIITDLGVTYCTLVSFGIGAAKGLNCETEDRCTPGMMKTGGGTCKTDVTKYPDGKGDPCCPWVKLPDSLCPAAAGESDIFNCHLGAMGNPNTDTDYPADADLKCTMDKPTTARDPDKGVTDNGQCCDPLGKSTTLPACNAHHLVIEFVAAAAKITKTPTDKLQQNCALKK